MTGGYGPTVTTGKTVLVSSTGQPLYLTDLADYTLVTNCDFTEYVKFVPTSLKAAVRDNFVYVVHVSPTVRMAVTRSTLQARLTGGEILAYQYSECSIQGNDCVYYGFIPTERQDIADTHKRHARVAAQAVRIFEKRGGVHVQSPLQTMVFEIARPHRALLLHPASAVERHIYYDGRHGRDLRGRNEGCAPVPVRRPVSQVRQQPGLLQSASKVQA